MLEAQEASAGGSTGEIHSAVMELSDPQPGLAWLDIGCGTGHVLRCVRDCHRPHSLIGVDLIDWLDDDLRADVRMIVGPAEREELPSADRVLMVECIEHLEAPWAVLRNAARTVAPGGCIVVTTPSVTNLRHRIELVVRGQLTSFRPDNQPHLSPCLPHVTERVMMEEGLATSVHYRARDMIPGWKRKLWPEWLRRRSPELLSISVVVTGRRST